MTPEFKSISRGLYLYEASIAALSDRYDDHEEADAEEGENGPALDAGTNDERKQLMLSLRALVVECEARAEEARVKAWRHRREAKAAWGRRQLCRLICGDREEVLGVDFRLRKQPEKVEIAHGKSLGDVGSSLLERTESVRLDKKKIKAQLKKTLCRRRGYVLGRARVQAQ